MTDETQPQNTEEKPKRRKKYAQVRDFKDYRPLFFTVDQAIEYMKVTKDTFYKWRKELGIGPWVIAHRKGRFYSGRDLAKMAHMLGTPVSLRSYDVKQRAKNINEAYETGRLK